MSRADVAVIRTGTANLASVLIGLQRAGARPRVIERPDDVLQAERIVLPGVGSFGAAMTQLNRDELAEPLRERAKEGRPLLAVCVGLQLLCESSAESPGFAGLGIVKGTVQRLPNSVRVPQLGWNIIEPDASCRFVEPGYAYFANSFAMTEVDEDQSCRLAWSNHGGRFVAALERNGLLACQFHPELSGPWGVALLRRWIELPGGGLC